MKKRVNSNVGILIILLFSLICFFLDYSFVSDKIGADNFFIDFINGKRDEVKIEYSVLSNEEALSVGSNLYDLICDYYSYYGPVIYDGNGKNIYFVKDDKGMFSVFTGEGYSVSRYSRLDVNKLKMYTSSNFVDSYISKNNFVYFNGNYYHKSYPRAIDSSYVDTKLEVVSISSDELLFNAISSYNSSNVKTDRFRVINSDGYWVIDEFIMPY